MTMLTMLTKDPKNAPKQRVHVLRRTKVLPAERFE